MVEVVAVWEDDELEAVVDEEEVVEEEVVVVVEAEEVVEEEEATVDEGAHEPAVGVVGKSQADNGGVKKLE